MIFHSFFIMKLSIFLILSLWTVTVWAKTEYIVWKQIPGNEESIQLGQVTYDVETRTGEWQPKQWQATTESVLVTLEEKTTGLKVSRMSRLPEDVRFTLGFSKTGELIFFDLTPRHKEDTVIVRGQLPVSIPSPQLKRLDPNADPHRKEEIDNRSFFARYWHIIIPVVLLLLLGGGGEEPQSGQTRK
jgi:hypothetical protein